MRNIIILLLAMSCCQTDGIGQTIVFDKNTRCRIGMGFQLSSAPSNMKDHLKKSGFGDKFNSAFDSVIDGGNDFYPQSRTIPVFFEMAFDRSLNKRVWLGMMVGIDQVESVKGYDRYGTGSGLFGGTYSTGQFVTLKHSAWFLSPQFSFGSADGKFGFYAGPSIDFHTLNVDWQNKGAEKNSQTKIGAMLGVRARFSDKLEGTVAYRFASSLEFSKSSTGTNSNFSTLPAKKINFNHLRLGLAYRFLL